MRFARAWKCVAGDTVATEVRNDERTAGTRIDSPGLRAMFGGPFRHGRGPVRDRTLALQRVRPLHPLLAAIRNSSDPK